MIFKQLFDADTSTYTYLIADSFTHEAIIIDPVIDQMTRDLRLIQEHGLKLKYTLETHVHADHITGAKALGNATGAITAVSSDCNSIGYDLTLKNGDVILFGHEEITVISTPGHTQGSVSYLWRDRIFTGDTLLIGGCGRTDFQGGSAEALWSSITETLFALDEQTLVYPGHDYKGRMVSCIGEEKRFNARIVGKSREEFIEIMNNLDLPMPKRIHEAVPANINAGASEASGYSNNLIESENLLQSISVAQLSEAIAKRKLNIIDVRTPGEFSTLKIANSINIPMDQINPEEVISRFGADAELYCICQTGTRSQIVTSRLRNFGMQRVVNVDGGTNAWVSLGFPVESGRRNVLSLDRQMRIFAGSLIVIGFAAGMFKFSQGFWLMGLIGLGLIYSGVTNSCAMSKLVSKMPWNN